MAVEIYEFAVLVPANTPQSAPQLSSLSMPPRVVTEVEIRVPPGPLGNLGFQLAAAGRPFIPRNAGAYVVTDDEVISWALEEQITSGAWQLIAYNTGDFPHTIHVRFLTQLPAARGAGALLPIPASVLSRSN